MTPIFVRPVREQLEHDRLIRFLQARYKRKFDVTSNVGDQQLGAVKLGVNIFYPDLVLMTGKKLAGLIEVETTESTNNLEAMAQWTHFSRARVPFHLYVPVLAVDAARRLCDANQVAASEIWTYRAVNDQFDLVRVFHDPNAIKIGNKMAPKVILRMPDPKPEPKLEPPPPPPPPPPAPAPVAKPAVVTKSAAQVKPLAPAKAVPAPVKPIAVAKPVKLVKVGKPAKPVKVAKKIKPAKPAQKKSVAKAKASGRAHSKPKTKASAKKRK